MIIEQVTLEKLPEVANQIIAFAANHKLWLFYGEMGAGKTTLIKQICKELGIQEETSSPTFSLVNEYKTLTGDTIYHFDFYRIKSMEEAYDIGYEDYLFSGNICLIEWPEKMENLLEQEHALQIKIFKTEDTRMIELSEAPL